MNKEVHELIETVLKVYIDFLLAFETLKKYFEAMRSLLEWIENKLELCMKNVNFCSTKTDYLDYDFT